MTVGHGIEGMDILAQAIEDEDEDVTLITSSSTLSEQLLYVVGGIFWFSAVPEGDDVGSQGLLHSGVAETTASEVVGTGSGVAGKEVATRSDVGDPKEDDGPFLLLSALFGLSKVRSPVEIVERELLRLRLGSQGFFIDVAGDGILPDDHRGNGQQEEKYQLSHDTPQ